MVKTTAAASANEPALTKNGRAMPAAISSPASGGPTNWFATVSTAQSRPFAVSSRSREQPPPVEPVGDRADRQGEHQPGDAGGRGDQRDLDRVPCHHRR